MKNSWDILEQSDMGCQFVCYIAEKCYFEGPDPPTKSDKNRDHGCRREPSCLGSKKDGQSKQQLYLDISPWRKHLPFQYRASSGTFLEESRSRIYQEHPTDIDCNHQVGKKRE